MSEKLLIGIGHRARQGKDVVASVIHHTYPALTRVIGFADALKAYCRVEHGMEGKDAPLLQRVGLEMRQSRHPEVWIDALWWAALDAPEMVIIVPDVRFANEVEFIRDNGGVLVGVGRYNHDGTRYVAPDRDPNHESEMALEGQDVWDYYIDAPSGAIHELCDAAVKTFDRIYDNWERQQAMRDILLECDHDAA